MIEQIACEAMAEGKILELRYDGYSRCVEVHAVGLSKAGNLVMCCWQVRGGSVHGEPTGWKFMRLDEASAAFLSDEPSQAPRRGYRQGDARMVRIIAQL